MKPISDLQNLLKSMEPKLNSGVFVFASIADDVVLEPSHVIASIREPEGLSVVMEESAAVKYGLTILFRCAWITLTVHSDLEAVGLTAAFASALGNVGISCNVIAGVYHDHIFVPVDMASQAINELCALQAVSTRQSHLEGH